MARIGARKHDTFKAVSTAPSINKTPVGNSTPPLPYPVANDLDNSVAIVPSVRLNSRPAYVLAQSTQPACKGDAPGSCNGIKSGTVSGEITPVRGSSTVRVGQQPIIREGDPCTLNGGNCPGVYVTSQTPNAISTRSTATARPRVTAETPAEKGFLDRLVEAAKGAGQWYKDNASDSLHDFAGDAMDKGGTIAVAGGTTAAVGGAMVVTGIGAAPGAVIATAGGAVSVVGGGVSAVGGISESVATALDGAAEFATSGQLPNLAVIATGYAERMVMSKIDKIAKFIPGRKRSKPRNEKSDQGGGTDGFSVVGSGGGDCGIKPYKDQKCPKGQQAHHIVPDFALRYGSRGKGAKGQDRIPGMPSLQDGPTICLSGNAKTAGSEHNAAHSGTDPRIASAGERTDNGSRGTAPIGEILDISIEEVSKIKPHCEEEIRKKTNDAFKGVDRSKYGRTTQQPPSKGSDAHGSLSRGDSHAPMGNRRNRRTGRKL